MKKTLGGVLSGLAALQFALPVAAVSWDNFNSIGLTTGSIYCSSDAGSTPVCTASQTTAESLSGSVFKLTAYSTPTLNPNGGNAPNASPTDTGTWIDARIRIYSGTGGGISIANTAQGNPATGIESNPPQHAMDNRGVNDILVVDFNPFDKAGQSQWDVSSFALGYTCKMSNMAHSNDDPTCSSTAGNSVTANAWLGGSGPINFTNGSLFTGFSTDGSTATLPGFTNLAVSVDPNNNKVRNVAGDNVGRYLVITPNLSGWKDAFKVKAIDATLVPPPPDSQVPLPGSVPLVGLALLALAWVSRSRRLRAVPIRIRR